MVNQILIKYDEKRYLSQFLCAPQYKLKRFVTMTTYWVPDLSNIKGFSGHLWHSILIFANKALYGGRRGGLMVSAWPPEWAVQVRALAGDMVLCSWLRHFTPTVPLSTQGPVVQRLDNAVHWINYYPAGSVVCFVNTYPLDSDSSGG